MNWLRLAEATTLIDHDVRRAREALGAGLASLGWCERAEYPNQQSILMCLCASK